MFSFANPQYFLLLLIIPLLLALFLLAKFSRTRNLQKFGHLEVLAKLMPDTSKYMPWIKITLQLIAVALIVVILARPRAGAKDQKVKVHGIEVMIALDVSNSMMASATDDPNGVSRLQLSKMILEKMIDNFENDKVGLIVFAGNAYTQLPITTDYVSAKMFLNEVSTKMVPTQGTAIGAAIKLAANSFTQNSKSQKAIVVITDGENHEDDAVAAATDARKSGIQVNVIGIGSTKGSTIPLGNGGLFKDDNGNVVTTCLDEKTAQEIAAAGKGAYISGSSSDAATTLIDHLQKLAKSDLQTFEYTQHDEQFPIFAWLALAFLILDIFAGNSKISWLKNINFFTKENKK
jgi:Ca-activated chloride channel family protein